MLSALSRQGDVRFMLHEDSMNQQRLIQFMNRLVWTSKRKVFLILDNLKVLLLRLKIGKHWMEEKSGHERRTML